MTRRPHAETEGSAIKDGAQDGKDGAAAQQRPTERSGRKAVIRK